MANSLLAEKTSTTCRGGTPPLTREEAEGCHVQAPDWALLDGAPRIERAWPFKNFRDTFAFVAKAADLAETAAPTRTSASAGAMRRSRCGPSRLRICMRTTSP